MRARRLSGGSGRLHAVRGFRAFSALGIAFGGLALAATTTGAATAGVTHTAVTTAASSPYHGDFARIYKGAPKRGELDCNGFSPVQRPIRASECTDIRGFAGVNNQNTWDDRFFDNGHYIGHDEPDTTFLSKHPGSGNNVNWNLTLGKDPAALPTATNPGQDVSHWFELTPAPWLSMAMCDPNSYPQLPCKPESDTNAPACSQALNCPPNSYPGGGSAFMEMQFYPPGNAPFYDNESCNNTDWCAALTIDSLECTDDYVSCNLDCEEPVNFAFVQVDGVLDTTGGGYIPDKKTFYMAPGDHVSVHMFDARVPATKNQRAFKVVIDDLTTGTRGAIQASAKNGFHTTSIANCSQSPWNFQPEYSTASAGNYVPWAALQTNISTEFETGHWEPCTSLSDPFPNNDAPSLGSNAGPNPFDENDTGGTYNQCNGPYETAGGKEGSETADGICYAAGDTHTGYAGPGTSTPPNEATGCQDNYEQNGDLDFDGTPYYRGEWPTSAWPTHRLPGSFVESLPTSKGWSYPQLFFQTDVALSEYYSGCRTTGKDCTVPPMGPGHFYPYWSEVERNGTCSLEFGNVSQGRGVFNLGEDHEYGTVQFAKLGYPEFESKIHQNTCGLMSGQAASVRA